MHGNSDVGLLLLALVLIGVPGFFTVRAVARHRGPQGRPRAGGGIVSGWLAHRRALRLRQVDHENGMHRERFRSLLRMREQAEREHRAESRAQARAGGRRGRTVPGEAWTAPGGGGAPDAPRSSQRPRFVRLHPEPPGAATEPPAGNSPGSAPAGTGPWARVLRLRPGRRPGSVRHYRPDEVPEHDGWEPPPDRDPPGPGVTVPDAPAWAPAASQAGRPPQSPEPLPRGGEGVPVPAPSRPAAGQPETPTLQGVVVTIMPDSPAALTVPGVEQIIEGAAALRRYIMSGNARAKQRGILAAEHVGDVFAATMRALARDMAEPGQHYGIEITEPIAMSALHFSTASLVLVDVNGRIAAVVRATEELRASGVQAPHHDQMTVQ